MDRRVGDVSFSAGGGKGRRLPTEPGCPARAAPENAARFGGSAAVVLATSERVLVTVHNRHGQVARDRDELRAALLRSPREIPSRFFYDDRGSRLFERITELPEYYQTRTEHALLRAIADRVAAAARASQLVEIGSGAATKARVLLDAMARAGQLQLYVPVDVAEGTMRRVAEELTAEYPELAVHGVVADFNDDLSLLPPLAPETSSRAGGAGDAQGAGPDSGARV